MIKVTCGMADGKILSLEIKGHAYSAEPGRDLVCSAVSAVTFGGLNALQNQEAFTIRIEEALVQVDVKGKASIHDSIVLETMLMQFDTIAKDNSQYIKIIKKGKPLS